MKKQFLFVLLILVSLGTNEVLAQKYAYIDSEYILEKVPDYAQAQEELDQLSKDWQNEIEQKYQEIEKLYQAYRSEQVLLPEEMKRKREEDIILKEKNVKDLQQKRFGMEGSLYQKRQELISPIQDKIYKAIKQLAKEKAYAFIFDISSQSTIMFADPKLDKSDMILKKLGVNPNKK